MPIRPFTQADVSAVIAIEQACAEFPWSERQFLSSVESGHCCSLLEDDGSAIGFSLFSLVLDEACLLNIAVMPGRQGKGYGRQLLWRGLLQMQGLGATRCYLEVRVSNLPAQALYQSLGFQVVGNRKGYYPARGGREDALVMARQLPMNTVDDVYDKARQ